MGIGPGNPANDRLFCIEAFFDEFAQRVNFLARLFEDGHEIECAILCCSYIEAIGNNLYPENKDSATNFSHVLREHGGDDFLAAIHPSWLLDALPKGRVVERRIHEKLARLLPSLGSRLYDPDPLVAHLSSHLDEFEVAVLRDNLWRGSIGNVIYTRIRSDLIKRGLGSTRLTFSGHSYSGREVPELTIERLFTPLRRILERARDISVKTRKWYGHLD